MDLDSYIERHREEWTELDRIARGGPRGLGRLDGDRIDETLRLYQRVSAHLAEVRTVYRDPRTTEYLTAVVARAHGAIYARRARRASRVATLLPAAIARTAPFAAVAGGVLIAVAAAILVWVAGSPEARAGILPPAARDAVEQAGDGGGFDGISPGAISTFILVNNVQVTFFAFGLGITLGIGTLVILLQNAELLGALAGAFHAADRAGYFWSLVLPHGLLELTAVFVGAGAGLRIGWALVDPGDRTRAAALAATATESVMVLATVIPALAVAAVVEGFVTGRTGSAPFEIGLGAALAAGYVGLLVWLARRRGPATATAAPSP